MYGCVCGCVVVVVVVVAAAGCFLVYIMVFSSLLQTGTACARVYTLSVKRNLSLVQGDAH